MPGITPIPATPLAKYVHAVLSPPQLQEWIKSRTVICQQLVAQLAVQLAVWPDAQPAVHHNRPLTTPFYYAQPAVQQAAQLGWTKRLRCPSFNLFWLVRSRTGMSSLEFGFAFSVQSNWGVLAGILFWVYRTERLGCPRWSIVLSLPEAARVALICLKFVRSDLGVLARILFWVSEKQLGCSRSNFVLSLWEQATGMSSLNFVWSLSEATGVSSLEFCFHFVRGEWGHLPSVRFYFSVSSKRLGCPRLNFSFSPFGSRGCSCYNFVFGLF